VSGYLAGDFAADAALLIEWLAQKWGPLHVLGHSLGAIAALGGAVLRPDLVKKLILEEPPFDGPVSIGPYLAGILTAKRAHDEDLLPVVRTYAPELGLALARIQAGMWERVAPGAIAAVLDQPEQVFGVTSWLAETTMPALILQADPAFGAHLTNEAATQAVQQLPQGHWRQVLGAGHIIHATHPAAFCQEVKDFLLP
jgi:pimeloyl-ACP methyl ester carboxylesterase